MIIQDSLIDKIDKFIRKEQHKRDIGHITFKITQSKSTNSIYVKAYSYYEGERIQSTFRISDHLNSNIDTKLVHKHTKFSFIERKILSMIKRIDHRIYRIKLNSISQKK